MLFSNGYGYSDKAAAIPYQTDHTQIVASVSKTWIGIALLQCIEQGKFTLDTDINQLLPFKVVNPNYPEHPITIKDLATHTSSIIYTIPDEHKIVFDEKTKIGQLSRKEQRIVKAIMKNPERDIGEYLETNLSPTGKRYKAKNFGKFPIGSQYKYSNMASTLAAHLVEITNDMSFAEYCQKNIIAPLDLANAAFNLNHPDPSKQAQHYFGKKQKRTPRYSHNFYPTGGLNISTDDLSIFLMEVIKGSQGKGKLLSAESYQLLLQPQFDSTQLPKNFPEDETNHGIFWTYRDHWIGHVGGGLGATSFMFFNKETGIGKIFTTNCELETNKQLVPQFVRIWREMDGFFR